MERTFRVKYEKSDLMTQLKHIATTLSEQMREKKLFGKTLTLKLKTEDFRVISRSKTVARHIQDSDDIFRIAKRFLLDQLPIRLRLMGIRLANFKGSAPALLRGQKKLDNFFRKSDDVVTTTPSIPKTNVTTTTTSLSKKKRKRKQNILESMYKVRLLKIRRNDLDGCRRWQAFEYEDRFFSMRSLQYSALRKFNTVPMIYINY